MSDSDALEEIIELFDVRSTAKTTKKRTSSQRNARIRFSKAHEAAAANVPRAAFYARPNRAEPGLPRLKFLERDD